MKQKTKWINYSIIGLLISIVCLNASCKKTREYAQFGDFYYVNETNHNISFYNQANPERYKEYSVAANSVTVIQKNQDAIKEVNPTSYRSPLTGYDPPLIVIFDRVKCWEITPNNEHSPLEIKNYVAEKLSERKYKFTYTFTEADYNRAATCP